MTLDSRKGRILQAIVNDYVETAEPIGSEWLVAHYDFGCKSATLRNEMAEMSEKGYLLQPHTSAGRIPSVLGYRYYVDRLMLPESLDLSQRHAQATTDPMQVEVEELVMLTCRLLSDMTQYPSVATPPIVETTRLHRLYVTLASPRHLLVVLLLSTGHVEHRLLEIDAMPTDSSLQRVTNYLNRILSGRDLEDIAMGSAQEMAPDIEGDRALGGTIHGLVKQTAILLTGDRMFLEGTSHILRQREFQNVIRLEQLLTALQRRSILWEAIRRAPESGDVTVVIGTENQAELMQDCSVVTSRYVIRDRIGGYIGVIGPTRMNYRRAVAAVGLMARSLSEALSRVNLE